jgi:hypothetical protein
VAREAQVELKRLELDRKRQAMEAQIAAARASFGAEEVELRREIEQDQKQGNMLRKALGDIAVTRSARGPFTQNSLRAKNGNGK